MGTRGVEYVNVSGLRGDGRRPRELRRLAAAVGVSPGADGSALVEMGLTRALAVVTGPREAPGGGGDADAATLRCSVTVAPFAGAERRKRRAGDRRLAETSAALAAALRAVLLARLYPRSEVEVRVVVLQSDGAALAAAVNAASLALADAGVGARDVLAACAAVHVGGYTLVDPTAAESASGGAELTLALLPESGGVTLAEMDARLPLDALAGVLDEAAAGARQAHAVMAAALREATLARVDARGGAR